MVDFEKQAVQDRYNAVEPSLPAPNVHTVTAERRQRKPTPTHRWAIASLVLLGYFWLSSSSGDGIRRRVHHHSGCSTDAPFLRPENATDFSQAKRGEVVWFDCADEQRYPSPLKCGRMKAPLDWTNDKDDRNASLAVIFYPAGAGKTPKDEVLGSLLTNPGGPGGSGFEFIARKNAAKNNELLAANFDTILGHKYNIVSFDPRGVGRTFPRMDCWNNTEKSYVHRIEAGSFGALYSHPGALDSEVGSQLSSTDLLSELCAADPFVKEHGKFVGTTAVARDMHLLHRFFGDKKINYWGFSYGTVLGSTFADMFPQDINRLIIDGVVDVPNYMEGLWSTNLKDTDGGFDGFFSECVKAGPKACALASQSSDAKELQKKVLDLLEELKYRPMPVIQSDVPQLLTFSMVLETFFTALYKPAGWPKLADMINDIINGNGTAFVNAYGDSTYHVPSIPESEEANAAIACGDGLREPRDKSWSIEQAKEHIGVLEKDSPLFGQFFANQAVKCIGSWKLRSNERHRGKFDTNSSFPLLTLGNDFDPVTPGRFADMMADKFGSAVSVRRAGYGHCSMSQPSKCINKIIGDYFVNGTVPEKGIKCDVDESPFPQPKNESSVVVSLSVEQAREMEVSEAMASISEAVAEYNARRLL
ncbi:Peptidase S33 tripeptidyl aminopeptidase-like, C-terminal [Kalmanozyma brasiliensis GHG001]|uniref:Proteinase n=1 Tax=Kalmanozyma brasiliensis (strain GHG001) TaxID=1365824 RepID=V5EYQ9_KALBG|nr:Peptidase S33 tripeptidyl aminopeptidase-like, C-terminal [Kalmanozyma brasiliensis GHG001]EST07939.1 Peptidase S33 tripeptidyl aminopeptidase-like, C-terminal [Kalmanozyma brasiliensis GHG001]